MEYTEYDYEEYEEEDDNVKKYKPLSPWRYAWYTILFSLPLLGFVFLVCFAFSEKNIHRRNYARSFFCLVVILILLALGEEIYYTILDLMI